MILGRRLIVLCPERTLGIISIIAGLCKNTKLSERVQLSNPFTRSFHANSRRSAASTQPITQATNNAIFPLLFVGWLLDNDLTCEIITRIDSSRRSWLSMPQSMNLSLPSGKAIPNYARQTRLCVLGISCPADGRGCFQSRLHHRSVVLGRESTCLQVQSIFDNLVACCRDKRDTNVTRHVRNGM